MPTRIVTMGVNVLNQQEMKFDLYCWVSPRQ
jgi:hypothetical protein